MPLRIGYKALKFDGRAADEEIVFQSQNQILNEFPLRGVSLI